MKILTALSLTILLYSIRIYLQNFPGITLYYWGDFQFFALIVFINALIYKFKPLYFTIFCCIVFLIREIVRHFSTSKYSDIPNRYKPKDVTITFKRCTKCSNVYDPTQKVGFFVFIFLLIYYNKSIKTNFEKMLVNFLP